MTNFDMVYFLNASNFLDGGDRFFINFILPNSLFFIFYYYFINEDFLRLQINILVFSILFILVSIIEIQIKFFFN